MLHGGFGRSIYRIGVRNLLAAVLLTVGLNAGLAQGITDDGPEVPEAGLPAQKPAKAVTFDILAVSWQPGFCETRPKAVECRDQTSSRFDATHFTLHGLWRAGVKNCPVAETASGGDAPARRWLALPELALSGALRSELKTKMPGVASGLDRHEWVSHGQCSGLDQEAYFGGSLAMLDALNASGLQILFSGSLDRAVTEDQINDALQASFGNEARGKVRMRCRKDGDRQVITGLTIGLAKPVTGQDSLALRIAQSAPVAIGCKAGIVDRAGLQ